MVQSSTQQQQQQPKPPVSAPPAMAGNGNGVTTTEDAASSGLRQARAVGQEFVYIYYMCANKCPQDLHRFYSACSYFVHGGRQLPRATVAADGEDAEADADSPSAGQAAIAARIAALGYVDCRTKILMVDSLPAPASGVLIQVCGEISNNAGPMRRFMQTFLLAPIGPKKYFVQNDIFRYQDEVFTSEDAAEATDHRDDVTAVEEAAAPAAAADTNGVEAAAEEPADEEPEAVDVQNGVEVDGDIAVADTAEEEQQQPVEAAAAAPAPPPPTEAPAASVMQPKEEEAGVEAAAEPSPAPPAAAAAAAGGKKNFAALFGGSSSQPPPQPQPPQAQPSRPSVRRQQPAQANGGGGSGGGHPAASAASAAAPDSTAVAVSAERREREAPDHLQVFVGNLAPNVLEAELAQVFAQFGDVAGCRITPGKPRMGHVSNFGFVTFASAASVQEAVAKPPSIHGIRVNVEEKKPSGFRRGGGGSGGGGGGRGGYRGGGGGYGGHQPRR